MTTKCLIVTSCPFGHITSLTILEVNTLLYILLCLASKCNKPLGMRNGRIRNGQVTASSSYNSNQAAWYGRLGRVKSGRAIGGWCAKYKNTNQWLKVDFGRLMRVRKIATQGRQDAGYWVTSFYCSFSADNLHWAVYREKNSDKVRTWNNCVSSRGDKESVILMGYVNFCITIFEDESHSTSRFGSIWRHLNHRSAVAWYCVRSPQAELSFILFYWDE